jgi:diaminopimelate decarboxylase
MELMNDFDYRDGRLLAEEVDVAELADRHGTPLFVYSRAHLERQFRALAGALRDVSPQIFYAVKANSSAAVIRAMARLGAGADVVSGGELFRAVRAGIEPGRIVFAGVGKTASEIEYAIGQGIQYFTVESEPEIERISACATRAGGVGRIAIRVNPDVDPKTHRYTSTGKKENKFGVDLERAERAYDLAASLPGIEIAGLHMHLGSPLSDERPYVEALDKVASLCARLKSRHASFRHLDIGGGFGIPYRPEDAPFDLDAFAAAVVPRLKASGLRVGIEPGRFIVGNAGILVARVQFAKESPFRRFLVVDAAMNDLIRPPLYDAFHRIRPVRETPGTILGDVVGPICESGDFLAKDRELPDAKAGDLLAVMGAGAYGMSMASNYNSRGRAAEVLVDGARSAMVRSRETWEDLVRGETIPDWLG